MEVSSTHLWFRIIRAHFLQVQRYQDDQQNQQAVLGRVPVRKKQNCFKVQAFQNMTADWSIR